MFETPYVLELCVFAVAFTLLHAFELCVFAGAFTLLHALELINLAISEFFKSDSQMDSILLKFSGLIFCKHHKHLDSKSIISFSE